jgi:nucleoside-diphosphate-sugar epimerase
MAMDNDSTIAATGASGHIGSRLALALAERGQTVRPLTRNDVAAREFAAAAREQGGRRVIHLGGIVHGDDLSPHLRNRCEVGESRVRAVCRR